MAKTLDTYVKVIVDCATCEVTDYLFANGGCFQFSMANQEHGMLLTVVIPQEYTVVLLLLTQQKLTTRPVTGLRVGHKEVTHLNSTDFWCQ